MELRYLYFPDIIPESHWLHNANSELYVCLFGEACHAVSPGKKLDFLPCFFFFFFPPHRNVPISRSVSLLSSGPHHWTNSTQGVPPSATAPFPLPEPATVSCSFPCCADWHLGLLLNTQLSVWGPKEHKTQWEMGMAQTSEESSWMLAWIHVGLELPRLRSS